MADVLTLKKSNCKNCYKCIRNCPVKAIRFSGNQAHIVPDACILCGQCLVVCPQNAKQVTDDTEKVRVLLQSGDPVYASIAPSFVANYDGVGIEGMREALRKLGFAGAEETAVGATIVKREYERILHEETRDVLISSCCHSVNLLIQKYFPDLLGYLLDVVSPMQAHCKLIKERVPNAKTVFIGPCVAKKDEAQRYGDTVDAVLTFEQLSQWFSREDITLSPDREANERSRARLFPTAGGILKTMDETVREGLGYSYMAVDGTENCMAALRDIRKGNIHRCFIEMNACAGACVGGPIMEKYHRSPVRDYIAVAQYAGPEDFDVEQPPREKLGKSMGVLETGASTFSEREITDTLRRMGKTKKEDELNCGSCGYNTCREKAVAILEGKAEVEMCLPFLKEKAESFSSGVINAAPDGILVLNENLEVQQINQTALQICNLRYATDVVGEPVVRILDPADFLRVQSTGRSVHGEKKYLAEYRRTVEQSIVYDKEFHTFLCILRDMTDAEAERERKAEIARQTVETADQVVSRQMEIVQEIASLLGETAAETKIALTKLKETIHHE